MFKCKLGSLLTSTTIPSASRYDSQVTNIQHEHHTTRFVEMSIWHCKCERISGLQKLCISHLLFAEYRTRIGFWTFMMSQTMLVAPPPKFRFSLSTEKIHTLSAECENSPLLSNSELKYSTAGTSRKLEGAWIWRHLQTFSRPAEILRALQTSQKWSTNTSQCPT